MQTLKLGEKTELRVNFKTLSPESSSKIKSPNTSTMLTIDGFDYYYFFYICSSSIISFLIQQTWLSLIRFWEFLIEVNPGKNFERMQ